MNEPMYRLVYDAATQGERVDPTTLVALSLALAALVGAVLALRRVLKRSPARANVAVALIVGIFLGFACTVFWYSRAASTQCKRWAESGEYDIVEGVVADMHPYGQYSAEQFTVNGVVFQYSPRGPVGGFKGRTAQGRAIWEGSKVRIGYRNGIILRLWIAKEGQLQRK